LRWGSGNSKIVARFLRIAEGEDWFEGKLKEVEMELEGGIPVEKSEENDLKLSREF
jgi:hypothetical protein